MNLAVIFKQIAIMLIGFGSLVFGMLMISPLTFISDYPPEIQAEYYRSQHKEATKKELTKLIKLKKLLAVIVSALTMEEQKQLQTLLTKLQDQWLKDHAAHHKKQ